MGMDVQSIVHVIIIFFILFGNVMFLILRKKETK
jgi:preprotein translocase subunit YajC